MGRKKRSFFFHLEEKKTTILPNNPISFLGMIVIIVLINSISDFRVISFLP